MSELKTTKNSALENSKRIVFKVDKNSLDLKARFLHKHKYPFTIVNSGSSVELYSDEWNCRAINNIFLPENMNFVKKVKKYAIDNYVAMKYRDRAYRLENIEYFSIKKSIKSGDVFEDVCCLDINGAYWQTAVMMGVISKEIYEEGLRKDKITRLSSLGSLAKRKEIFRYDGVNYNHVETIRSYETENLWFAICKRVSDVMQELMKSLGDDFVFYWVDGIYFKRTDENIKKVTEYLESCSYECKQEKVSKIEFLDNTFNVHSDTGKSSKLFSWNPESKKPKSNISLSEAYQLMEYGKKILKEK
jgi:hypothetical protein